MKIVHTIDRALTFFEKGFVVFSLGTMVTVAFIQVILREVFSTGFIWADDLLRHLVLWNGFIAGSIVTREGRHIAIDIMPRLLSTSSKRWTEIFVNTGAMAFTLFLLKCSIHFIQTERQYATMSEALHINMWVLELIFPITFGLLSVRFFLRLIEVASRKEA